MEIVKDVMEAADPIIRNLDIMVAVVLLISLFVNVFPLGEIGRYLRGLPGSLLGALIGGSMMGNPTNGYIIGGELLHSGVDLTVVLAFLAAWVTVGFLQIPVEARFLGLKFSVVRNIVSLLFSVLVAFVLGVLL